MPVAGVTDDVTISDVDGSNLKGFMVIRDRRLLRQFGLEDAQQIQNRQLTMGELTEAEADPRISKPWTQGNWAGGIGGVFVTDDPFKLAIATKIDTSVDGFIKLARELKTTTVDSNPNEFVPSGFAIVGTEVWAFVGRDVYEWDYSVLDWNIGTEPQASAVIYRNGVEFSGETYVPCWTAATDVPARYIHRADGDSSGVWTLIDASTPNSFKYFIPTINASGDAILVGAHIGTATHQIRTTTDPTASANWSGVTNVGSSSFPITALVEGANNQVLICKTNGIWSFPANGIVENLTPSFTAQVHPDNFKGAHDWNGHILLPLGGGGMYELIGTKLYNVSLSIYAPEQKILHGRVAAIHGRPEQLFIMVLDSSNTKYHILMAEWAEVGDDPIDYHWHKVAEIAYTTGTDANHAALFAEGIPGPSNQIHHRIWAGVESTGSSLLPHFYPCVNDAEDGFTNDSDAEMTTLADDSNFRRVPKTYSKIDFVHRNLGAGGRQVAVEYSTDGGTFQTDLAGGGAPGNILNSTGVTTTLTFPSGTTGKLLELKLKPVQTSVTTTTPQIDKITAESTIRPNPIETMPLNIYLADNLQKLNGGRKSSLKGDLNQLRAWNDQAAEVIVSYDEGTGVGVETKDMVFVSGSLQVKNMSHEPGRRAELLVQVQLLEV